MTWRISACMPAKPCTACPPWCRRQPLHNPAAAATSFSEVPGPGLAPSVEVTWQRWLIL